MEKLLENGLVKSKIYRYVEELKLFVALLKMRKINNFMISMRIPGKVIERGRKWHSSLDCRTVITSNQGKVTVEHVEDYSWDDVRHYQYDQHQERGFYITSEGKYQEFYTRFEQGDELYHWQRHIIDPSRIDQIILDQYNERTNVCWDTFMRYRISVYSDREGDQLSDPQIKTLLDLLTPMTEFKSVSMYLFKIE